MLVLVVVFVFCVCVVGVILCDWQRLVDVGVSPTDNMITVYCNPVLSTPLAASPQAGPTPATTATGTGRVNRSPQQAPARADSPPATAAAAPSPGPSPAAAALSPAAVLASLQRAISPDLVAPLLEMGFSETRAVKALILNLLNTEMAMEWLLEHGDDPGQPKEQPTNNTEQGTTRHDKKRGTDKGQGITTVETQQDQQIDRSNNKSTTLCVCLCFVCVQISINLYQLNN